MSTVVATFMQGKNIIMYHDAVGLCQYDSRSVNSLSREPRRLGYIDISTYRSIADLGSKRKRRYKNNFVVYAIISFSSFFSD